jgi:glycosyltransferase involved in cell wall biosynthesis
MLTAVDPSDPRQGDQWRAWALMHGLGEVADLMVLQWGGTTKGGHRVFALGNRKGRAARWKALAARQFPLATAPYRAPFPPIEGNPDLVAAFQLKCARWALSVPARCRLLDLTDSLGLYLSEFMVWEWTPHRVALLGVSREEVDLAREFDEVWVASARDADWLRERGVSQVRVVENGVPRVKPLPPGDPAQLLFVGNLEYQPNRVGLGHFLESLWPVLARQHFRLTLVGKGTDRIRRTGVVGKGLVDAEELEACYRAAGVVVAPILIGAGTPTKVLEGLAYGRPVVGWRVGMSGLTPAQRSAVLTMRSQSEWIHTLAELREPSVWADRAARGPRTVKPWGRAAAAAARDLLDSTSSPGAG